MLLNWCSGSRVESGQASRRCGLRPMLPVGVCREESPAVALVVGGGAPDP